jgi:hypothetical protein
MGAALSALAKRPFHPEAFLLLAEIAQSVGDGQTAKLCAEHARRIAPGWKPARKFSEPTPQRRRTTGVVETAGRSPRFKAQSSKSLRLHDREK